MEKRVATEVAEQEFVRWVEAMGLKRKLNPDLLPEEDKSALRITKDEVLGAIEDGRLVVDEKGQFVFTPTSGDTTAIIFREPNGAAFLSRDKFGDGQDQRKAFSVLCEITGQNLSRYGSMLNRDLTVCQSILVLFTAR